MAFCANCGTALTNESGFCGSCGKPLGTMNQAPAASPQAAVPSRSPAAGPGVTSNVAAALSYVFGLVTGIIFLVLEPYKHDRFVRFHAMQSILFCVAAIVFSMAWSIVVRIMIYLSGWTAVVLAPIGLVISVGFFVFWLFLMYQAYSLHEYHIPYVGAIASKQLG